MFNFWRLCGLVCLRRFDRFFHGFLFLVGFCWHSFSFADSEVNTTIKETPDVTFDRVQAIFGFNLDSTNTKLRTLLLAIAMDHTSKNSPHIHEHIGIPFIVDKGPNYWVSRLAAGDRSLEVLVNNALLYLFAKEALPNAEETALKLFESAADDGYWPADFYVAETYLENELTRNYSNLPPLRAEMDAMSQQTAKTAMVHLNRCAEVGFAPCQYRIGFWLMQSPKSLNDGIRVLMVAVDSTVKDSRYGTDLKGALSNAARTIIEHHSETNIESNVVEAYVGLLDSLEGEIE